MFSTLSQMPRKKNPPVPVVAFIMATRTASYGNTQSNTPDPNCDLALDLALDHTLDSQSRTAAVRIKKASLVWTDLMEETLFNELLEQDRLGKRADMGFKSEAWIVVRDAIQEIYIGPLVIEIQQLKNKESNYKALYKDWKWLKDQSGFGLGSRYWCNYCIFTSLQ
jgi:hypothetical protein